MTPKVAFWPSSTLHPRMGTYPFWVWQDNEIVEDAVALPIPLQSVSKEYLLAIGIYDASIGERLSLPPISDFGSGRFALLKVIVR